MSMMVSDLARLRELEQIIESGLRSFMQIGPALMEVREREMYRADGFDGFVEYLESKPWGISEAHAYRMIDAVKVQEAISPIGETHLNLEQTRELAPLLKKDGPDAVKKVYEEAVAEAEENGTKVTAKTLKEKVKESAPSTLKGDKPTPNRNKIDDQLEQHLCEIKKLIPRWETRFVDSRSGREGRKRVALAEEIAEWLTGEYVPAHAALVTPLATVPT